MFNEMTIVKYFVNYDVTPLILFFSLLIRKLINEVTNKILLISYQKYFATISLDPLNMCILDPCFYSLTVSHNRYTSYETFPQKNTAVIFFNIYEVPLKHDSL